MGFENAGDRLRARIDELGWTQNDLADRLGVSAGVVSRWLSGERTPSLEMAFRIQNSEVGIAADAWLRSSPDDTGPHARQHGSGEHSAIDVDATGTD
jgi:transcriptional regulator with XRE-family HTH domain